MAKNYTVCRVQRETSELKAEAPKVEDRNEAAHSIVETLSKDDPTTLTIISMRESGLSYRKIQVALKQRGITMSAMAIRNRYLKATGESKTGTKKTTEVKELEFERNDGGRREYLVKGYDRRAKLYVGDCGTRAIAQLLNKPYGEVYSYIERNGHNPTKGTPHRIFEPYLERAGYCKIETGSIHKSLTLKRLYELAPSLFTLGVMVEVRRHVYFVDRGTIKDTWDARRRYVRALWVHRTVYSRAINELLSNYKAPGHMATRFEIHCLSYELANILETKGIKLGPGWSKSKNGIFSEVEGIATELMSKYNWANGSEHSWESIVMSADSILKTRAFRHNNLSVVESAGSSNESKAPTTKKETNMFLATIESIKVESKQFTCMGWVFTSDTDREFTLKTDNPQTWIRKGSCYTVHANHKGEIQSVLKSSERYDAINSWHRSVHNSIVNSHSALTLFNVTYKGFTGYVEARDMAHAQAFALEHTPNCEVRGEFKQSIKSMPDYYSARTAVPHADLGVELINEGDGESLTNGHEYKRGALVIERIRVRHTDPLEDRRNRRFAYACEDIRYGARKGAEYWILLNPESMAIVEAVRANLERAESEVERWRSEYNMPSKTEANNESAENESAEANDERATTEDPEDVVAILEQIVEYRENHELSYRAIAKKMGLVPMTVRRRYLKAKTK